MPIIHAKFHSKDGKRLILIADDEMINREMLGHMLEDEYEILYAVNGQETIELMYRYADTLSLVLLDLMMPIMSGLEVLEKIHEDKTFQYLPIIVVTSEKETESKALSIGARDFISKPYPSVDVIRARVANAIELAEDRDIIQVTERDHLTGLYNREYFYRYAQQYDYHHRDLEMDCIIVDVNHFHMINERYGKAYGDEVLRRIGEQVREMVIDSGGIVCRRSADTFMVYCPHRDDYQQIMEKASIYLSDDGSAENRVRLRMGVYANADKEIDIERRFDRAKMAADTVKGSFTKTIGFYNNSLHEKELYAEHLIEDFPTAVAEKQFQVYYQPKFDVQPDTPVLASAEALVRWNHPDLGLISPGVFIPLFEENGLIEKLDCYVWKETARQIREWKDQLGYSVPVSVNVSRIDMYDPKLTDTLADIISEHGLTGKDLMLEVTESAYTQDSEQIIETAMRLREMGFMIEMDDFGTGYSSLNMISSLPIDVLKLDMMFIRDAFRPNGDTHMLEVIIDLSRYLNVPVIAEGVETAEQLRALKELGCNLVQGYFFSKPVPANEFEPFILQKLEADVAEEQKPIEGTEKPTVDIEKDDWQEQLVNVRKSESEQKHDNSDSDIPSPKEHTGIQLRTASIFFVILAVIAAAGLLLTDISVGNGYKKMEQASDRYISAQLAATDLESGSDYLTDRVRCFVVTGEVEYLKDFYEEVEVTKRRDKAVEHLESLLEGSDENALNSLNTALSLSNELIATENKAIRLMLEAGNYNTEDIPPGVNAVKLTDEELDMSDDELRRRAQRLVFDNDYMHHKDRIRENVGLCTQSLIRSSSAELERASARLSLLVNFQTAMTIAFLLIVLCIVFIITQMIRKPLTQMVRKMQQQEEIEPTGVEELRFVTRTYNSILKENEEQRERLKHEASHDALTGLFNRGAYDLLIESADREHMALLLVDVDNFKTINDSYGHAVGDRVLKRVADILRHSFRSVDILCRIGGDEFAVVMTRANSSMASIVRNKITRANTMLMHPKDDLPPVSLSVGVAFSDRKNPTGDIFRDADTALYRTKEAGRNGCTIYE